MKTLITAIVASLVFGVAANAELVNSQNDIPSQINTFTNKPAEYLTADRTKLVMRVHIGWRISNSKAFFVKFPSDSTLAAQRQLESMLRSAESGVIGRHILSDFINSNPSKLKLDEIKKEIQNALDTIAAANNIGISIESVGVVDVSELLK